MRKGLLLTCLAGVFASYMLSSCSGVFSNYTSLFSSLPDTDAGRQAIPSDRFFYVKISDATFRGSQGYDLLDYVMYEKENGPGYDCKIPKGEESTTEDLYCMFDVQEGDLFLHEIEFEYNVPEGMCDYFTFQTHWHYNQESGRGPETVYKRIKYTDVLFCPLLLSEGEDCPEGCEKTEGPLEGTSGCTKAEDGFLYCKNSNDHDDLCKESLSELCRFNDTENGNENCCVGETDIIDTTKPSNEEPGEGQWGGNLQQCIGGLGRVAWPPEGFSGGYTADGLPQPIITKSERGIRGDYKIPAIIDILKRKIKKEAAPKSRKYSLVTANHWIGIDDRTNLPKFYKSFNDTDNYHYPIPDGYPYITFTCEDKSSEVKHRIHLIIREWNTKEEFREFKSGGTGDPDVAKQEGSECDYYEVKEDYIREDNKDCNDMYDVDDFMTTGEGYPELEYTGGG